MRREGQFGRAVVAALISALLATACDGASGGTVPAPGPPPKERGIRGELIGAEPASNLHLSRADCAALAREAQARRGRPLRWDSRPEAPLSRCQLLGPGLEIGLYLDTAHAAHQRYENRMVEQAQFGAPDPARVPHPVPGVGESAAGAHGASWVPAYSSLFAVRGGRFLTVTYSASGLSRTQRRQAAIATARHAFRLSARP